MKTGIKTDLTLPSSVEIAITVILKKFLKVQGRTLQAISAGKRDSKIIFFDKGVEEIQRNLKIF